MKQAMIIAAVAAATAEAGPGRLNGNKLKQDRRFNEYASKYNKNIESTAAYEKKQLNFHLRDEAINAQNRKAD